MRTTIYLDDHLAEQLRRAAADRSMSLSAFLAESGRASLNPAPPEPEAFELLTYGTGGILPGVSLDRTGDLLAAEDREHYGEAK